MNKTGIVTFHRALSYGANLQAYALQNFMFKLGIDNEIVDYSCQYMIDRYQKTFRKSNNPNKLREFAWNLSTAPTVWKKRKSTEEFVGKHLKLSRPFNSENIGEADKEFSNFVTGSDQVWSPTCVGFDPVYFLTFTTPEKKHSYAASIATEKIPEDKKDEFVRRIKDFDDPSLREPSGAKLVTSLTGKEAHSNIDPSLLLTAEDWDKICSDKKPSYPYILIFTVPKPSRLVDYAVDLAKKKNLKVLFLNNFNIKKYKDTISYLDPVGITEFISLIKNAEYVCTNSFHGNAFCLLYHKKFVVETDTPVAKNIRSRDLCLKVGLGSRLLHDGNNPDIDGETDWNKVDEILSAERKVSEDYLRKICKGE